MAALNPSNPLAAAGKRAHFIFFRSTQKNQAFEEVRGRKWRCRTRTRTCIRNPNRIPRIGPRILRRRRRFPVRRPTPGLLLRGCAEGVRPDGPGLRQPNAPGHLLAVEDAPMGPAGAREGARRVALQRGSHVRLGGRAVLEYEYDSYIFWDN
ncbi:hypothetical protein TB2_032359 [Malus domestica]